MKKGLAIGYVLTICCALGFIHWGSEAVTVLSEQLPVQREHCIVIDAGHGGIDGGARSCTGKPESTYNLEISLRLQDLLHFLGHSTKMIRTTDESVYTEGETIAQKKVSDLRQRVKIVNSTDSGILISIHQNQYPDRSSYGAQVFYSGTEGSQLLASDMQKALSSCLIPHSRRHEKKCKGIYLMEKIRRPGILLECGFISNPEEEKRLSDAYYQKQLCCVIGTVFSRFLG